MNPLNNLGVGINVGFGADIVMLVVIVGTDVDHHQVCRRMLVKVPGLWVIWVRL